ncbi:MAG: glycosyltransferase [Polyangiaceae bacterium]|nr:glycosyltransferase [Polyangiaceae bacterium]
MSEVGLVIPCYNEAERLDFALVEQLLADPRVKLFLVDDGSTDATFERLTEFSFLHPGRVEVVPIRPNGGKAEAVRRGLLRALEDGARLVGYLDADMATPPEEMLRLLATLEKSSALLALGSRVRMLGADIQRTTARHYLGRVFATLASLSLSLPVYDTQCGAKVARDHATLRRALSYPFTSRWAFDVELLDRLTADREYAYTMADLVEMPLKTWGERGGSKLSSKAMVKAGLDLVGIGIKRRWGHR